MTTGMDRLYSLICCNSFSPIGLPSGISMSDNTRSGALSFTNCSARSELLAGSTSWRCSRNTSDSTDTIAGSSSTIIIFAINSSCALTRGSPLVPFITGAGSLPSGAPLELHHLIQFEDR